MTKRKKSISGKKTLDQKTTLDNRAIGLKLAQLRVRLGLTATELSRKIRMSQAQMSRLENGRQGFRSSTLAKIAEALGVTPAYFFMRDEEISVGDVVREGGDLYGPGVPHELKEALHSPRFKHFVTKSARIFLEDEIAFSKLNHLVRKAKL